VCQSTHACLTQPSPFLPKRLIDVDSQDGQSRVVLYESAGQTGRYACLSHCWGDCQPLCKTTKATIERNKQAIEWGLLPTTFRDAIKFTRLLGLRYLWIDPICIIQDSSDDWTEQSALMADIYGRAYITLCATSSASDNEGFFYAIPEHLRPHQIPCKSRIGTDYEVCVRTLSKGQHIPSWETQTIKCTNAAETKMRPEFPLLTRAWCFQERLLSPRLLHFTHGEIMWECGELSTCECNNYSSSDGVAPHMLQNQNFKHKYKQSFACEDSSAVVTCCGSTEHQHKLQSLWHSIVAHYSELNLTSSQDRLPALSGVAKQIIQARPGDVYLEGLWRNSLLSDLAWFVRGEGIRPLHGLSPSWSWPAVEESVTFACPITRDTSFDNCSILEATVKPVGSDPTGKVTAGYIILSAPLFEARFQVWQHDEDAKDILFILEGNGYQTEFRLDRISDFVNGKIKCCDVLTGVGLWVSEESRDFYLILAPVEAGADGLVTYRRVGMLWQPGKYIKEHWYLQGMKPRVLKVI
jgi:hypothetical protein